MSRSAPYVTAGSVAIIAGALVVAQVVADGLVQSGPVYTVAQVQTGLQRAPRSWVGRTVRIRAILRCCQLAPSPAPPALLDADGSSADALLAYWHGANPLLDIVRRLPLLSSLVRHSYGQMSVYRVQLQPGAQLGCGYRTCYSAFLVDGGP